MIKPAIENNLNRIKAKILFTAQKSSRTADEIKIIAVSKKKPSSDILTAYRLGQNDFAENYIQDFVAKSDQLKGHHINWHFVGHIQRNKAKKLVGRAQLIHTLDRMSLAQTLDKLCAGKNIQQDCLVQVKISKEENKQGCSVSNLFSLIHELNNLKNINIKGLMTIGTLTNDLRQTRSEFRTIRELKDKINKDNIYKAPLTELSMGMSSDYTIAIEEGATMVRIGTEIFGERAS